MREYIESFIELYKINGIFNGLINVGILLLVMIIILEIVYFIKFGEIM